MKCARPVECGNYSMGAYFTGTKQTKQTELAKLTRIFPEKEKWKKENRSPFV
jgi:hypothetical protein